MSCCYSCQPFNLGAFKCDECIVLPFKADQSGNWKIIAEFSTRVIEIQSAHADDKYLTFDNHFNEFSTPIIEIIRPDGSIFAIDVVKDDVVIATYKRFKLSIKEFTSIEQIPVKSLELCGSDSEGSEIKICSTF